MKPFLCILIIASCFGAGKAKSLEFTYRVRLLQELYQGFKLLQIEIQYSRDHLPILFEKRAQQECGILSNFFKTVCQRLETGEHSFFDCWEAAILTVYENCPLTDVDREVLRQLGRELGKSDLQGQKSAFDRFFSRLEAQMKEAESIKKQKGQMYQSLGLYSGILIVILLL